MLLLLGAAPAAAQGINLRWTACVADGGARNQSFACNTNTGTHVLVPSIVLAAPMIVTGISGTIDIIAADLALPAWWDFGGCRSGSLFLNPAFVGVTRCELWNFPCGQGGINSYVVGAAGPNTARIEFTSQSCGVPRSLAAGTEYIGPVLVINSTRTVGSPSCGGCQTGVCLSLTRLRLNTVNFTTPALPPDGNVATWQGVGLTPGGICQAATATRRSAWGEIKALYR